MSKAERQARRHERKVDRKIHKHMKKNDIGQSDGLEVNEDGDVVYNPAGDHRHDPHRPPNTPSV